MIKSLSEANKRENGDIFPCSRFLGQNKWRLGKLHDVSFEVAVGSPITQQNAENFDCINRNCPFFHCCECKCLYVNQLKTGNIHKPSELQCLFQKSFFFACLNHVFLDVKP